MAPRRVLLADDHRMVLEGFRKLLEPEFNVVGMAEDGQQLLEAAEKLRPEVIVMDISMPILNGIECARQIHKSQSHIKLVFLTMHADQNYVTEAFRAGASAYLLKSSSASELPFAIREALKDRFYLTPQVARYSVSALVQPPSGPSGNDAGATGSPGLTPRQTEVLQLVAEGRSNKEIAALLRTSVKTVEFHKSRIMRKLDLHTTAELTRHAISLGIISA